MGRSPDRLERLGGREVYRTHRDGAINTPETSSASDGGLATKTHCDVQFEEAKDRAREWWDVKRLFMKW